MEGSCYTLMNPLSQNSGTVFFVAISKIDSITEYFQLCRTEFKFLEMLFFVDFIDF